jgi:hypothetical protein
MAPSIDQLLCSPDYYLHSLDGDDAVFVSMDSAAYKRSIFLDGRISPAAEGSVRVPLCALTATESKPLGLGWIFHIAHCGSTLLARAIEALSAPHNIMLREPLTLRQISLDPSLASVQNVLPLLAKRYPGGSHTIIKANVPVNFLLSEIAEHDTGAPAIFLHMHLPDYLLAILRSDNHRGWVRAIVVQFAAPLKVTAPLRDAEAAAALWLGMVRRFACAIGDMPNARTLDAEVFFADPASSLAGATKQLGIAADP